MVFPNNKEIDKVFLDMSAALLGLELPSTLP